MERQRIQSDEIEGFGGGGLPDIFSDSSPANTGIVTVCHGPYAEQLPVVGETIRRVRELYSDRFDLDPESQAVIDGQLVDDDAIIEAGQSLVFVRRAGEKGMPLYNPNQGWKIR